MMGTSAEDENLTARALSVEDKASDTLPTVVAESIDSKDPDKAFAHVPSHNQSHVDDNADLKAVRRKIDWRIVPVMAACFSLQFLDKVLINVSQAPELSSQRS